MISRVAVPEIAEVDLAPSDTSYVLPCNFTCEADSSMWTVCAPAAEIRKRAMTTW
jgi:hypothetical protein